MLFDAVYKSCLVVNKRVAIHLFSHHERNRALFYCMLHVTLGIAFYALDRSKNYSDPNLCSGIG